MSVPGLNYPCVMFVVYILRNVFKRLLKFQSPNKIINLTLNRHHMPIIRICVYVHANEVSPINRLRRFGDLARSRTRMSKH